MISILYFWPKFSCIGRGIVTAPQSDILARNNIWREGTAQELKAYQKKHPSFKNQPNEYKYKMKLGDSADNKTNANDFHGMTVRNYLGLVKRTDIMGEVVGVNHLIPHTLQEGRAIENNDPRITRYMYRSKLLRMFFSFKHHIYSIFFLFFLYQ